MEQQSILIAELIKAGAIIIAAAITARSAIYLYRYKDRRNKRRKHGYIEQRITLDTEIHGLLGVLLERTTSSRAYIFQFHPENMPLQFSCSYEEVRAGVSSEIDNRQYLLLSQHTNFMTKLTNDPNSCYDVNMLVIERFGKLLASQGVNVIAVHPIYNDFNNLIGFVGLDYCQGYSIDCDVKDILRDFSYNVGIKLKDYAG